MALIVPTHPLHTSFMAIPLALYGNMYGNMVNDLLYFRESRNGPIHY